MRTRQSRVEDCTHTPQGAEIARDDLAVRVNNERLGWRLHRPVGGDPVAAVHDGGIRNMQILPIRLHVGGLIANRHTDERDPLGHVGRRQLIHLGLLRAARRTPGAEEVDDGGMALLGTEIKVLVVGGGRGKAGGRSGADRSTPRWCSAACGLLQATPAQQPDAGRGQGGLAWAIECDHDGKDAEPRHVLVQSNASGYRTAVPRSVIRATNSSGFAAPAGMSSVPVVLAPRSGGLSVLLTPRIESPEKGRWSLPGGFMSPDERPEETAQRKLTEKTGVGAVYLEQLQTYGDPARDPRGWIPTVAYLALIDAAILRETETAARWFGVDDLPPLAFDHNAIVGDGVERLRGKLWWSNIAVGLLPARFTMPQARQLYEAISGHRYEPSNFRRELERSGLIRATGRVARGATGRPAMLYEFVDRHPQWSTRRSKPPATAAGG